MGGRTDMNKLMKLMLCLSLFLSMISGGTFAYAQNASIGTFESVPALPDKAKHVFLVDDTLAVGNKVYVLAHSKLYVYDADRNRWTVIAGAKRKNYQALTLLNDGKIMLLGGDHPSNGLKSEAEIYDPAANTFTLAEPMPAYGKSSRINAVTLKNGKVLVMGEYTVYGVDHPIAYMYDPEARSWQSYNLSPVGHDLLINGDGYALSYGGGLDDWFTSGQLYNPETENFYSIPTAPNPYSFSAQIVLPDGKFMLAGGTSGGSVIIPQSRVSIYDHHRNLWYEVAPMLTPRAYPGAALLPDGRVLVAGGYNDGYLKSSEIYDPVKNVWTKGPEMNNVYGSPVMHTLENGDIFVMAKAGDSVVHAEILRVSQQLKKHAEPTKPAPAPQLPGKEIAYKTHFTKDGWVYRTSYRLDPEKNFRFDHGNFKYTDMYTVKIHESTGEMKVLISGRHSFLLEKDGYIYFVQNTELKKIGLNDAFAEPVLYSGPFVPRKGAAQKDMNTGDPIRFSIEHFDGEYVYGWSTFRWGYETAGVPVRYKYDGSEFQFLSAAPGRANAGTPFMDFAGDWIVYLSNPLDVMSYSAQVRFDDRLPGYALQAVKKDGSAEQELARVRWYSIHNGKIYYQAEDKAEMYMINPDGTGKKLIHKGMIFMYFYKDKIYYTDWDGHEIMVMNLDGTGKKTIKTGKKNMDLSIVSVKDGVLTYKVLYTDRYAKRTHPNIDPFWLEETYELDLNTMKEKMIATTG
jgi:hypothetical protein